VDSSSLLGAYGHYKNEFLSSSQGTKTASQTGHISDNRIATDLHGVSSVDKDGKRFMKKEWQQGRELS